MYEHINIRKHFSKLTNFQLRKFSVILLQKLFDPDEKKKILNHQALTKNTLQITVNEIFSTNVNENEYLIKNFNEEYELYVFFIFRKKD